MALFLTHKENEAGEKFLTILKHEKCKHRIYYSSMSWTLSYQKMLSSCHFTSFEKQFRRSTATRVSKRLIIKKIKNEEQRQKQHQQQQTTATTRIYVGLSVNDPDNRKYEYF